VSECDTWANLRRAERQRDKALAELERLTATLIAVTRRMAERTAVLQAIADDDVGDSPDLIGHAERVRRAAREALNERAPLERLDTGPQPATHDGSAPGRRSESGAALRVTVAIVMPCDPATLRRQTGMYRTAGPGVTLIGTVWDGRVMLGCRVDAADYHAGNVVSRAADVIGCKGGGRSDYAQAGGGDPALLSVATLMAAVRPRYQSDARPAVGQPAFEAGDAVYAAAVLAADARVARRLRAWVASDGGPEDFG